MIKVNLIEKNTSKRIEKAIIWRERHLPSMPSYSKALHAALGLSHEEALAFQNASLLKFERWAALSPLLRYPAGGGIDFRSLDLKEILHDLTNPVLSEGEKILILKVINVGQGSYVFENWKSGDTIEQKRKLLKQLAELEDFYGIENFQITAQKLVKIAKGSPEIKENPMPPRVIDVSSNNPSIKSVLREAQIAGLQNLQSCFIGIVAGGLGKRFGFNDPEGKPFPKGEFRFSPIKQKNLFRILAENILSLQNIYYLTYDKNVDIPMIFMTSPANDEATKENFKKELYYGLGEDQLKTFQQVMVPLVDDNANWMMKSPYEIQDGPHGHGDWLYGLQKSGLAYELLQDNRPHGFGINIEDSGIFIYSLEHIGMGITSSRPFGFLTVPRKAGFAEGAIVNVKAEGQTKIINIEYTNLKASGISDEADPSTGYSHYPANVAGYYEHLKKLLPLIEKERFPGEVLNLSKKNKAFREGREIDIVGDRPEAQRQGIAEAIHGTAEHELPHVLGYERRFFMPAKEQYEPKTFFFMADKTAESARQQYINMFAEWLTGAGIKIPSREYVAVDKKGNKENIALFDSVIIELTPCFANRHEILTQKIKGGEIKEGSTLYLSGFHSKMEDLSLNGTLIIDVENETGASRGNRIIPNAQATGKYRIQGLTVINKGFAKKIDGNGVWHGELEEKESCRIVIKGNGELEIKPGVVIYGQTDIIVNGGESVTIEHDYNNEKGYREIRKQNKDASWWYKLEINPNPTVPEFVKLKTVYPANVGNFTLMHPGKIIDINYIQNVRSILAQLDSLHQEELKVLSHAFKVQGSFVYDVEFKYDEERKKIHPHIIVKKGTKRGIAEPYPSLVDIEQLPATDHKAGTISPSPQQIFVNPVAQTKGEIFKGKHYIAIPNKDQNEIILLLGEFNEALNGTKKEEAFEFKFQSLVKFASDEGLTITQELKGKIKEIFHTVKWSTFFELSIGEIYHKYFEPNITKEIKSPLEV
ncbi:MAG: UTP--glucose-1-phosphate uridylyltransferase [Candidatus Saganbacteria bacterium]|nr:UTP--glucose-1-phosphate uridylyltransferase [Candidatus Saganbacteria bacterium]